MREPAADAQRLDLWLWCARLRKTRADCARLVEAGAVRINRQPTDKAHARVRPGDVLTIAQGHGERGRIVVWRVLGLAARRGPPAEARALYDDVAATDGSSIFKPSGSAWRLGKCDKTEG